MCYLCLFVCYDGCPAGLDHMSNMAGVLYETRADYHEVVKQSQPRETGNIRYSRRRKKAQEHNTINKHK